MNIKVISLLQNWLENTTSCLALSLFRSSSSGRSSWDWNFLMVGRWPFSCLGLPSSWDKLRIWRHQPELDSWLTSGFRKNADHNSVLELKAPYKDASRTWMTKQGETIMPGDAGFLTLGVSLMSFTPLHTPTNRFHFLYMYILVLFGAGFLQQKSPKNSARSLLKHESWCLGTSKTQNSHNLTPNRLTHVAVHFCWLLLFSHQFQLSLIPAWSCAKTFRASTTSSSWMHTSTICEMKPLVRLSKIQPPGKPSVPFFEATVAGFWGKVDGN